MSTEPDALPVEEPTYTPPPTVDLGDGRVVLFDEATSGFYRVRMPNGEVQAFPATGDATPENAVADIVTNPAPPVPTVAHLSRLQLKSRFTPGEWEAIIAATESDPNVAAFYREYSLADYIASDDPLTIAALNYLVSVDLLTAERAAQLLAP